MSVPDYHMEKAYVLSVGNIEQSGTIVYLPIYMSYLLKEKTFDDAMIVDVEEKKEAVAVHLVRRLPFLKRLHIV